MEIMICRPKYTLRAIRYDGTTECLEFIKEHFEGIDLTEVGDQLFFNQSKKPVLVSTGMIVMEKIYDKLNSKSFSVETEKMFNNLYTVY